MKRWAFHLIFYFVVCFLCYDTVIAQSSETVSPYVLSDLQYDSYPEFSRLVFSSNNKIDFTYYELHDPYRIVVDLLGVSFCELQEYIEYDQGLIKSIEIVESQYVQKPQGLDEYFYAIDYIIVTPYSDFPYTISSAENGKVIALDIGTKAPPGIRVSIVYPEDNGEQQPVAGTEHQEEAPVQGAQLTKDDLAKDFSDELTIGENTIDYINFEDVDDSMLVVLSTKDSMTYTASRGYYPVFNIVLKPQGLIYTDLQERKEFDSGYIKSVSVIRDKNSPMPKALDEYYYPVEFIVIEPAVDLPFDLYSNSDNTISILEIYYPDIKEEVKEIVDDETRKEEIARDHERQEEEEFKKAAKKELITMLKEEIKKENFLKDAKIEELKKEELERRKIEASQKVESIGQEVIKDLLIKGKGTLSLNQSQLIAIENSPQAKTAREEVKLSMLKKRDAFRALFPNVKLKASHTVGDVLENQGFTEEIYGIEAEHPLYQGGRLMNAYKQSSVNVDLSEARYKKIEHELYYKVAEAYHSTVTAIMNLRLQQQLLREAEPIFKLAEKRHKSGLSTSLEILNVQSRYNQIQFQIATAQRDLALARFKLQQAMGLDISKEDIDVSEVDIELPFKVIDINLYECLEAAANNHPDMLVNRFLAESSEYGEKIAKGKEGFRVDLTGFYGRADSYYNTESKNLQEDWNIGVKVSKPFWFASPSYSFTKEKTSRKVGETDRTGTTVNSGEIALLDKDSLAIGSEIEESRINKQKAENDLIEARRQSALSIKESYYNYQEAVIQVRNSLEKVRFHEEAVKVARSQAELNEALQSQLLESLIQLVDEKSVYIKALSDYNLAIIKLNNAIGIRDYFKID
jgi:outer membrane protein TolC